MIVHSVSASEFFSSLDTLQKNAGEIFLDYIEERESILCIFLNLVKKERFAFRLPLVSKEDVLVKLQTCWPGYFKVEEVEGAKDDEMNLGPYHPLFRGDIRPIIKMKGESVEGLRFQSGYRRLGLEERLLKEGHEQAAFLVSHLSPSSSPTANILWCIGIESLAQVDIPSRAKIIRMLFLELARVRSHLVFFKRFAELLGLDILSARCLEQTLFLKKLYEGYGLSYAHPMLCVPGGLFKDMPEAWPFELKEYLQTLERFLAGLSKDLFSSRLVFDRTSLASISSQKALESSLTGPLLRSCGIKFDNRKMSPLYFYDQLDFEIPLGNKGTAFERLLVRHEELLQSVAILRQIFNFIPVGEKSVPVVLTGHAHQYVSLEAPEGEFGLYLSMGNGELQKVKFRSPSEFHLRFLEQHSLGLNLSDFLVNYSSYNISISEMDR